MSQYHSEKLLLFSVSFNLIEHEQVVGKVSVTIACADVHDAIEAARGMELERAEGRGLRFDAVHSHGDVAVVRRRVQ